LQTLRTVVNRTLALAIIFLFGVLGMAIVYLFPVSILTCRYVEPKQVDCQLQERIVGLILVREISIIDLKRTYIAREDQTREDEDGNEYTVTISQVVLDSTSGEVVLRGTEEGKQFAGRTTRRINNYLDAATDESLRLWHAAWIETLFATLGGGVLLGLALFLFGVWVVEVVGLSEKVKDQMVRFRRKIGLDRRKA
jgi:hypothetical protein